MFKSIKKLSIAAFFISFAVIVLHIPETNSFFRDSVKIRDISFMTGSWVSKSDVIINEIMWMGSSGDPEDEWIELRNMTGHDIDLSGWNIQQGGKGKGDGQHIEIPNGYSIKKDGYFLITKKKWDETVVNLKEDLKKDEGMTHVSGMDLDDDGEQLILTNKNKNGIVIDTANGDGKWYKGDNGDLMQSMERKDSATDGVDEESWKTCSEEECSDGKYWRVPDGNNFGTPGKDNI